MSICTLQEVLDFLKITSQSFTVDASNDLLLMKYDSGTVKDVSLADGTYTGDTIAAALKTAIDTALTCTSTVTWSASTRKFTFSIPAGHTLSYTHAGSTLGLDIGLNQDHTSALIFTSDLAVGDPTADVSLIHLAVEKWVQNWCGRTFEVTSYKERYNGDGENFLILRQYPVVALTRLALWPLNVIRVMNTERSTNATVSVTDTGVLLYKDGVTTTLLFSAYTTFYAIVTAINAVGSGWVAVVEAPEYNNFISTELIPRYGLYCLESNWAYMQMPYQRGEDDFDVDTERGIIYLYRYGQLDYTFGDNRSRVGFPRGTRNIFVDYQAGYSTMPEDLKMAVKIIIQMIYQRREESGFGTTSLSISGGFGTSFENEIPWEARNILETSYKSHTRGAY